MIGDTSLTQAFMKAFFSELIRKNIRYCILHNAEDVASGTSHDIDMCVDVTSLTEAATILQQTASEQGWNMHLQTGSIRDTFNAKSYHYHYIDEQAQRITLIHFDFVPVTAWKGREVISNATLLAGADESGLFRSAAQEVMAVVDLFPHLLYNGYIKDKYKQRIHQAFLSIPEKITPIINRFLPETLTKTIISYVQEQRWEDILKLRNTITQQTLLRAPKRRWTQFCHIIRKLCKPSGIMVAFQGVDGSGKSTIINELPKVLGNSFTGDTFDYYHWRPGFLKAEKKLTSEGDPITDTRPHLHTPDGRIKSFLKLGFHTLDYFFGYWCRVRKQISQGHLVVFDRYYYDFYMDKKRYCLTISNPLVRFFQFFVPEPDLTFLLIGNAEQIYQRKKEIPVKEIQAQIDRLLEHKKKFPDVVIIDVNQSIPKVRFEVCRRLLKKLAKK